MAGDWIKMRADLFTHPKVVRISSALKADRLRTVGGLMSTWCLFDAHSIDGTLPGYTSETLDAHLGWQGFSAAMCLVDWLLDDGESLSLPSFDTHNGASAKRRAMDADRKREDRKASAPKADKKRTRGEKRREENKEDLAPEVLIPLDDGSEHPVTLVEITEWKAAYPRIDPLAESRKARAWCIANPAKRKTVRGVATFLNGWMARAQKDAESKPASKASIPGGGRQEL